MVKITRCFRGSVIPGNWTAAPGLRCKVVGKQLPGLAILGGTVLSVLKLVVLSLHRVEIAVDTTVGEL